MNELITFKEVKAIDIFGGSGLDDLLKQITDEVESLVPDLSTAKGRSAIASLASKVSKSKTHLDGLGKDLVADQKAKLKLVDNDRKKMRDYMDALRDKTRQPLTDWEAEEEARQQAIKDKIMAFDALCTDLNDLTSIQLTERLAKVKSFVIDDSFGEFANTAASNKDLAVTVLEAAIVKTTQREKEQAELLALREKQAAQDKKDAEEKIRQEGELRAKQEAEDLAAAIANRIEDEKIEAKKKYDEVVKAAERLAELGKQQAIKAQEDAEQAKVDAELKAKEAAEKSKRDIEAAAQKERDRIEAERVAEELASKKREADTKHKAKINNAAAEAMVSFLKTYADADNIYDMKLMQAKQIVKAIAQGKIPHTKISY